MSLKRKIDVIDIEHQIWKILDKYGIKAPGKDSLAYDIRLKLEELRIIK